MWYRSLISYMAKLQTGAIQQTTEDKIWPTCKYGPSRGFSWQSWL